MPITAAAGVVAMGSPAGAALSDVGPVDPATGFPGWYRDSTGLALELCLDGAPNCLAGAADLLDNGAEGEAFWFAADATAGRMDAHLAIEAAYFGVGQPISFARSQFQADGLVPGATYTITDPFAQHECTTDADRPRTRCRFETGGTFESTLTGPIGPFLTWDTFGTTGAGAPPVGYIGDNTTPHRVVGSPTGFNMLRVEGPDINDSGTDACPTVDGPISDCAETDLFVIQGKVAPGPAARVENSALDLGNVRRPVTRTVTYTSLGTEPTQVSAATISGPGADAFSVASNTCGVPVAPGASCVIGVRYTPVPGQSSSATLNITDNTGTARAVSLHGSSLAVTRLSRSRLAMGKQKVRTGPSRAKIVDVRNTGVAPLRVRRVRSSSRDFAVTEACPARLAVGRNCAVRVAFRPRTAGRKTATLTVVDGTGRHRVTLTGRATAPRISAIRGLSYGRARVGRAKNRVVRVRNTGDAVMVFARRSLRGDGKAHFRLGGATAEPCRRGLRVRPGKSCNVAVSFVPRARGAKSARLVMRADGQRRTVRLFGRGIR